MKSKITGIILVVIILTSTYLLFNLKTVSAATSDPSQLKIFIGPNKVLADNSIYNCISVQLQDSGGKPARGLQDTTVSLSSSLITIGTVDATITISKGSTFATANFHSTFTPGTTTIAATATGYGTVQSTITTVAPIPTQLGIYGIPSVLPADGRQYAAIMVQLQDSSGSPAKAPIEGVQVTLSCSNTNVGTVPATITIPGGQTYIVTTFTTNGTTKGEAMITATAQGYTTDQTKMTTQYTTTTPSKLQLFIGPPKVPADKNGYRQVAVQLLDAAGNIVRPSSDRIITMTSSDETIGKIDSQIIIPSTETYALATLTSTYKAGTTTITAVATDLTYATGTIGTAGFIPSKLAVYCVPPTLPADNATYQTIQVQLQDSAGRPAQDPEADVTVSLFSSEPTVGDVSTTLTIPFGKTQATGTFTAKNSPSSTTITAQGSGYTPGEAKITTYVIDFSSLEVTLTANPQSINNGNKTEITVHITVGGTPITGATIKFTSNNGGTFTTTRDVGQGDYKTTYTALSFSKATTCTITASASKTGYINAEGTVQITVGPVATTISSNNATLVLCIKDPDGNQLNNTLVTSLVQPTGMKTLTGITNATGYVSFQNLTTGLYTFSIIRQGYTPMNQTINYKGQPLSLSLTLIEGTPQTDNTLIIVLSIVAVAIVIAAIGGVFIIRRRKSSNVKKLQDLQKQLKYKYE